MKMICPCVAILHRPAFFATFFTAAFLFLQPPAQAQQNRAANVELPPSRYVLAPSFDAASIDTDADPCTDFYRFACGKFAATHPIPVDQTFVSQLYLLYNTNTQKMNDLLTKYAAGGPSRLSNEQKIGDYYAACMNTRLIEERNLTPIQPLLYEINRVTMAGLLHLVGKLTRYGVKGLFVFGEGQDFKDSTKQVAIIDQGGLGLPERDYYTRADASDVEVREQYVAHVAKMLSFAGEPVPQALRDAKSILLFETKLAEASMTATERRDPEATYHPQALQEFEASLKGISLRPFLQGIHAPKIDSLVNASPNYFPAMVDAVRSSDLQTLRAYLRYHLVTAYAELLPKRFHTENFDFYGHKLEGQPEERARWKYCTYAVDGHLGEALGQIYVQQYFAGDAKARTLEIVRDIESTMERNIDAVEWMSPVTRVRAKEKLHGITNRIGYPESWRNYSKLKVSSADAFGNAERATAFENDRKLEKIGQAVDKLEWSMTPATVNAYYNQSMNNINFPAGILQPAFYDPNADSARNYGHIGAIIGHELTHGFDDWGKKFDAQGNLADWWTLEDTKNFEARTACVVNEYGSFIAVDDLKVNGKLTLGENIADSGGLLLAFMAYLDRAKKDDLDINKKFDGYTGPQRFYIAYAQNWCGHSRPARIRQLVLTDPHSPEQFRVNGAIINQPGFASAFDCKKNSPMTPVNSCRVW